MPLFMPTAGVDPVYLQSQLLNPHLMATETIRPTRRR
jgi:hypothetical protein